MPLRFNDRGFTWGLVRGCALGSLLGPVGLYVLTNTELMSLELNHWPSFNLGLNWLGSNMGSALVLFLIVIAFHIRGVFQLQQNLKDENTAIEKVAQAEHWLEILESLAFGIGVLWTAIGMRAALLNALGDSSALEAGNENAALILEKLVEGGILVALSTTIAGGIAGYLLRLLRVFYLGFSLRCYYESYEQRQNSELLRALTRIERSILAKDNVFTLEDYTIK